MGNPSLRLSEVLIGGALRVKCNAYLNVAVERFLSASERSFSWTAFTEEFLDCHGRIEDRFGTDD